MKLKFNLKILDESEYRWRNMHRMDYRTCKPSKAKKLYAYVKSIQLKKL